MSGVKSLTEIKALRRQFKQQKKKVVFTNGVFDLIHAGHVDYLTKAKALGDILIVGMNTDESVRSIKGDKRPILNQDERAFLVSSLKPVDYVIFFGENTPKEIIDEIIPDILVKGADWSIDKIVGRETVEKHGGEVKTIEFVNDQSTSKVIDLIINKFWMSPHNIVGNSPQLQKIINLADKAALSDSNILIEGETGTGKELFAEYIHKHSTRADKPFVVINCASLPDQLIESELFGHERGAFTDAKNTKQGLVEIANGGTLLLDEIGELSLPLQPKLLRFLENGEYRRIGGVANLNSNVRVIGATNKNLLEEADNKNFRRDLLFRLNEITLTIPPLRDRKEDIPVLAKFYLETKSSVRSPKKLSPKSEQVLLNYNFPGNVRELEHTIERAIIFSKGENIEPDDLKLPVSATPIITQIVMNEEDMRIAEILSMDDMEKHHIAKILKLNKWDRTQSANQLGISIETLYAKIKKYKIEEDKYTNN